MFPFHCNKCFRRRKYETSLQLLVSRCGHILCTDCVQANCCICNRPFNSVAINKDMPTPMAEYFSSPMKQYQHYKKVMKFHHEQERRLVEHLCTSNGTEMKKVQTEIHGYAKLNDSIKVQIEHERERIRKLREYTSYYDRRLEQTRYMAPPIPSQPRPRFTKRSQNVENVIQTDATSNMPKRFTPTIRPNIICPNSPTLSGNNSSLITTEGTDIIKSTTKKARTPPPLLSFSQHKRLNPQFTYKSSD